MVLIGLDEAPAAALQWWHWALMFIALPVAAFVGAWAVKLWPLFLKSRQQRAKERLAAVAQEARLKRDAGEQVRAEYAEFFAHQRDEINSLRNDRDASNARIKAIFEEIRALDKMHADCLVKNERLAARVEVLAETIVGLRTAHSVSMSPTRNEAIVVADDQGVIREWNSACTAMFHWKTWEAVGRSIEMLVPPAMKERFRQAWADVLASGREVRRGPFLYTAYTKDGRAIEVEATYTSWSEMEDGRWRRMFSAAIRQRPTDAQGRPAEELADVEELRAGLLPEVSTLTAIRKTEQEAARTAGENPTTVTAEPAPPGGATIHVPPGATVEVRPDGSEPAPPAGGDSFPGERLT